jgi:hypothetical protein
VTDSNGNTFSANVNAHGNFLLEEGAGATPPFHARIVSGRREASMVGSVPTGDCNSCHTEAGTKGAPGRIRVP